MKIPKKEAIIYPIITARNPTPDPLTGFVHWTDPCPYRVTTHLEKAKKERMAQYAPRRPKFTCEIIEEENL